MPEHPNIIFFHAESWDGRMLANMGHPALKNATPNVDRLAQAGTQFDTTYCSHPICCPSRANMWSGQYTHHCESWNNHKGLETYMWSLLGELPDTHTVKTYGKLDYMSGGHTLLARLSAWLGPAGINRPIFRLLGYHGQLLHRLRSTGRRSCAPLARRKRVLTENENDPFQKLDSLTYKRYPVYRSVVFMKSQKNGVLWVQ